MHAGQLSPQTNLISQLLNCFENTSTDGIRYGDPVPSIGVYIKLNQIQTRTNLGHIPQWKKWRQNLLGNLLKLFGKAKKEDLYHHNSRS